jgi:hypothetical protein
MDQGRNDGSITTHNTTTVMVLQLTTLRRCYNSDGAKAHNVTGATTATMALQLAMLRHCCSNDGATTRNAIALRH